MKKRTAVILSGVFLIFALTGCQNRTQEEGNRGEEPEAVQEEKTEESAEGEADASLNFELPADVEFVCPFSAGGGSDLYARMIANIIGEQGMLGKRTITVSNKPGGGGAVGDAYTVTKSPDGTTITTYVSAQITSPMVTGSGITYDQLTPICNLAMDEYTFGVPSSAEYQTIEELIAYATEHPGEVTVGGSGSGTEDELVTGLLEMYCDVDLEYIAYDSSAEVMTAMLGGHINAGIFNPNETISQYEAGEVTLIAAYGPERISVLPDVPTFTELGYPEVQFQQFRGIFGPGGMDEETVAFWSGVFEQAVQDPSWTEDYLATNGLTGQFISGREYEEFINGEAEKYSAVLNELGLLAQ